VRNKKFEACSHYSFGPEDVEMGPKDRWVPRIKETGAGRTPLRKENLFEKKESGGPMTIAEKRRISECQRKGLSVECERGIK